MSGRLREPWTEGTVKRATIRVLHPLLVALGLLPAAFLLAEALNDRLGANPIEEITHRTGDWTIWLLLGTLAVTPLRRLTRVNELIRYRRTIGLLAFTYGCLHFLTYLVLDQGFVLDPAFALAYVAEDIAKRPYITVGFTALLLLVPLAVTSTRGWIRRMGGGRWNTLHRLIYVAGALGVLHYLWLVKGDQPKPVWHALVLVGLLLFRVWDGRGRRRAAEDGGRQVRASPSPVLPRPSPSL